MTPITILEQIRLSNTMKCVTDYTLVLNPFTGEQRNISKDEARELILSHKLQRYVIKKTNENSGTEILGAVWDTKEQSFKKVYGVDEYSARLKRTIKIKDKTGDALEEAKREVREKTSLYREKLHRAIHTMFREPYNKDKEITL